MARKEKITPYRPCTIKEVPVELADKALALAWEVNPVNRPPVESVLASLAMGTAVALMNPLEACPSESSPLPPGFLAVYTTRYWGPKGVDLSVSFTDNPPAALRDRILSHMNAWGEYGNIVFRWTQGTGQVRISRARGGYWSYLGTDVLSIRTSEPTMNLEGFTMNTSEREFIRVVRHEVGHTLGFPHEHLRRDLIQRLDVQKALAYFRRTQGWNEAQIRSNVLTPLEERQIMGSAVTDEVSLMAYGLPGSITKDGRPIPGGADFSEIDKAFVAKLYPKAKPPEPPPPTAPSLRLSVNLPAGNYALVRAEG